LSFVILRNHSSSALTFHADQIQRYGGDAGIRDFGALESALFRPQTGYYDDLIIEAAALWESMAQNHPFIDGNKRAAFAVTDVFLKMNGILITASPEDIVSFVYSLYDVKTFNFEELATWLRDNTDGCFVVNTPGTDLGEPHD